MCCNSWGLKESDTTERIHFRALEKEITTHCSVLAWRIPGTGKSGGLPAMGSHRVGHDLLDLAAAAAALHRSLPTLNGAKTQLPCSTQPGLSKQKER